MDYRDKIISDIAEKECKRISRKVILALQKMTEDMQSGGDSPLKNIWDEICVQVQYQESEMWDAYLLTVSQMILPEVEKLDKHIKQAIWLQTHEGLNWDEDENYEDSKTAPFCEDDITRHILHSYILTAAEDWTNKRIEKYLEGDFD